MTDVNIYAHSETFQFDERAAICPRGPSITALLGHSLITTKWKTGIFVEALCPEEIYASVVYVALKHCGECYVMNR